MLMTGIALGACCSAAALVTLTRITGFKWIVRNATWVDVGVTVGLGALFVGTSIGMIVAIVGGLITALFLSACVAIDKGIARMKMPSWPKRKAKKAQAESADDYFDPAPRKPQGPVVIYLDNSEPMPSPADAPVIN